MTIRIKPRTTAVFLGAIVGLLLLADLVTVVSKHYWGHDYVRGLIPLFDMDKEQNIPTYFTVAEILLCACLAYVVAVAEKNRRRRDHLYWMGLCFICLYLSIDEFASIHELVVNRFFRQGGDISKPFYFSWVIPYSVVAIAVGLLYVRFLLRLPAHIRRLIIVSGCLYVGGAIVAEFFVGYRFEHYSHWRKDLIYDLIVACAETLEMVGLLTLIYALMSYIDRYVKDLVFRITSSPSD